MRVFDMTVTGAETVNSETPLHNGMVFWISPSRLEQSACEKSASH
jgi:hypothetical protein